MSTDHSPPPLTLPWPTEMQQRRRLRSNLLLPRCVRAWVSPRPRYRPTRCTSRERCRSTDVRGAETELSVTVRTGSARPRGTPPLTFWACKTSRFAEIACAAARSDGRCGTRRARTPVPSSRVWQLFGLVRDLVDGACDDPADPWDGFVRKRDGTKCRSSQHEPLSPSPVL